MATKTKKPAARKPAAKRSTKPKHPETAVSPHPFADEQKVEIHEAEKVTVERQEGRPPIPDPVATATVTKKGELKVRLPVGSYVASGEITKQMREPHSEPFTVHEYVAFRVKEA